MGNSNQINFNADDDVRKLLDTAENKTRVLNEGVRLYFKQLKKKPLLEDRVALIEKRLNELEAK